MMYKAAITAKPAANIMAETANLIGAYTEAKAKTTPKKKRMITTNVPSRSLASIKETHAVLIIQFYACKLE